MSIPNRKKLRRIVLTLLLVEALLLLSFVGCGQTAAENESGAAVETVNAPETPQNGAGEREDETLVDSPEASKTPAEPQETADSEKTETTSQTVETPTPSTAASTPIQTPAPTAGTTPTQTPPPVSATPAPESTHVHDWQPVYTTVHHDAVTEEVKVIDLEATEGWDEITSYDAIQCRCGAVFTSYDSFWAHSSSYYDTDEGLVAHGGYTTILVQNTIHHEGTPEISHYETVIVTPAYDEQVIDHYTCSCGEIKPV